MPWKEINYTWNIVEVNEGDLDGGVKSMHAKWWKDPNSKSVRARDLFKQARWQMQGWYDASDERQRAENINQRIERQNILFPIYVIVLLNIVAASYFLLRRYFRATSLVFRT